MSSAQRLPIDIADLLHHRVVEQERIEFKEGWNPEPIVRTLCAFANDFQNIGGGYVVIGVKSVDGSPVFPPEGVPPALLQHGRGEGPGAPRAHQADRNDPI